MSKLRSIFVTVLCLILVGFFCDKKSSTEPDDENGNGEHPAALVGTWELTQVEIGGQTMTPEQIGQEITVIFRADGTYTMEQTTDDETETENGTWTTTDSTITLTPTGGEPDTVPYTLAGNKLRVTVTMEMDLDEDGVEEEVEVTMEFTKQ